MGPVAGRDAPPLSAVESSTAVPDLRVQLAVLDAQDVPIAAGGFADEHLIHLRCRHVDPRGQGQLLVGHQPAAVGHLDVIIVPVELGGQSQLALRAGIGAVAPGAVAVVTVAGSVFKLGCAHVLIQQQQHLRRSLVERLDFCAGEGPLVETHIVEEAVEVLVASVIGETNVDARLPIKARGVFGAARSLDAIYVELLATHSAAKGVRHVMPVAIGVVGARSVDSFVVRDVGVQVAVVQVDVPVVAVAAQRAVVHGEDAAVGASRLEPQRQRVDLF